MAAAAMPRLAALHRHLRSEPAAAGTQAAHREPPPARVAGDDATSGDTHTARRLDLAGDAPPTALELYQFDLNGYIIIKGALSAAEVRALNDHLDSLPRPRMGEWIGRAHVTATGGSGFAHGAQIQQCYELGGPFEDLIDHPSFFGKICRFLGPEAGGTGDSGWDNHPHGLPTIDEAFVNFRSEGGAISMHGPQNSESAKAQYRVGVGGSFFSGQINMALALSPIGPDDGATMVIPGAHKSNIDYRTVLERPDGPGSMGGVLGAVELHLQPGDVLLFVDCLTHGAARRTNPGVRRTVWHRYTMAWSRLRWGYTPSTALCDRLAAGDSPRRAQIVDPHYGRVLAHTPQADPAVSFEEGQAWSPAYFKAEAETADKHAA